METTYEVTEAKDGKQFKSYYVVWKLLSTCVDSVSILGLNRTMQYGNGYDENMCLCPQLLFKSYYVVWKPRFVAKNPKIIGCLNRTMQYGNDIEAGKIVIFKQV